MIMKIAQNKVLTGTVLLMSAFLLGGCATSSTTSTSSHKATSAKVVKKSHKEAKKDTTSNVVTKSDVSSQSNSNSAIVASARKVNASNYQGSQTAQTNQGVAKSTSSQPVTVKKSDTDVLDSFFTASGVQRQNGDQYIVQNQGNGNYRVEIRNTGKNQDQNVANLTGFYNYNANNHQVQKMDPVTGQFN